jgi:hypothetical protein
MYDLSTDEWGSTTSEGKDLRNVAFANYFPASFGGNFGIGASSTVKEYEHIEAISLGVGVTYIMPLDQKSVESCSHKYEIFHAIRTWENARAANAFSRTIKNQLTDPTKSWHLEQIDNNNWKLYQTVNKEKETVFNLTRDIAGGY